MRFDRRFISVAILAFYASHVVAGRPVHLWQHSVGHGSCCGGLVSETGEDHSSDQHEHSGNQCCHHHHHHDDDSHDEEGNEDHSPHKNHQHDSSACKVCQVLGQAQHGPIELETAITLAVFPAKSIVFPDFVASPSRSGFQSRAPPLFFF